MAASEKVFVDSNYLIALFSPTDSNRKRAKILEKNLEAQQAQLILSNFIFLETVTVLSQRRGREVAIDVGTLLKTESIVTIITIDELLNNMAWQIFQSVPHKNISFVDCGTIALMQAENISTLLTFDTTDFKKLHTIYPFTFYE